MLSYLLEQAADVAIKETRLHHKLAALAEIDPDAAVVHVVRDPRAVTASMLLGRRRRTDIYPDADTFFTARTGRRLWSSRRISREVLERRRSPICPTTSPTSCARWSCGRPAFETTTGDGRRLFGDRYATVRLEDLREDPRGELARIYALTGRPAPPRWAPGRRRTSTATRAFTWATTRDGRAPSGC